MASSSVSFWMLLITVCSTDGFMQYLIDLCQFNSTELKDIEYSRSVYYNQVEYARFTSSLGKFVGYTKYGIHNAEYWNNDTAYINQLRAQKETVCQHNIPIWYSNVLSKSAEPYVLLYSTTPPSGRHPSMLVCSVYDFYPKTIKVSWFRDGKEVTSDVTSTEEMENGDWYYQIHSHLEYTPRSGEKISCVVEHASLKEPLRTDWDPSMPESERNKIAIGASGLVLGLVLSLAGFIYYKRKARGRTLVPTTN
ncbi:H-2 class II histocompatibility antigen, E-S beta chain-like [Acanthochromis polyacanthus]|uniref:H-2 class II histocompatibility antigen, E-S beta chain-like n=1 Tax=Acanthochromis polyacanthus TaxID=80966 RepID=UPI00223418DE|nr:H-2 class II histocompatibility antigen, E-S beta chain-like [Acanthochromis polyacanthus]